MRTFILTSVLLLSTSVFAQSFRGIDENGNDCFIDLHRNKDDVEVKVRSEIGDAFLSGAVTGQNIELTDSTYQGVGGESIKNTYSLNVALEGETPVSYKFQRQIVHKYFVRMIQQSQNATLFEILKEEAQYAKALLGIRSVDKKTLKIECKI
jgi:hypothetical protein